MALSEIIPVEPDLGNAGVGRIEMKYFIPFLPIYGERVFYFITKQEIES